jgi:N-acetylglucosamine-6-phosphate deacetylase
MKQAFLADEILTGSMMVSGQVLLTENKKIIGILPFSDLPSDFNLQSFPGCFITPGFIDLQLYGGNGKLFSNSLDMDSLEATFAYCTTGGCSHFMMTMATNSMENFLKGIEVAGEYIASGKKGLIGLHLEGPWINPAKRGAHIESFIKKPSRRDVEQVIARGRGIVKMITLAPEECDDEIIQLLMDNGIIVSAGHSNSSYAQASHAFRMGVPAATHLFNAMSPLQGREPGMVGAIYDSASVMSSIVCDGVHVDFASVRISKKILGERLFFITDAVTSITEGHYRHVFQGDRYTLPDGTLSGSCMTMVSTLKNAVQKAGISLEESIKMCSVYPARLLKDPDLGKILPGQQADFNIINRETFDLVSSVFY